MNFSKKSLGITSGVIVTLVAITVIAASWFKDNRGILDVFLSFQLIVNNESDYDIDSVEVGVFQSDDSGNIVNNASKHHYSKVIKSGRKATIRPKLSFIGTGGLYMMYTDSRGKDVERTVCSYAEYGATGTTKVTITNDKIKVEEDCW